MDRLLGPANPINPERIRALCELCWWDGFYRGLIAGLLVGALAGIAIARLLREEKRNGP